MASMWKDLAMAAAASDSPADTGGRRTARSSTAAPFRDDGRHRVAVLVRPGVLPLELGLVHQLFGAARGRGGPAGDAAGATGAPLYEVVTCAIVPGPLRTNADFTVHVAHGPEALEDADTVIVPATHEEGATESTGRLGDPLAAALARVRRPGTRVASVCTGAFVLAAAGWLDGARATTHWKSAEDFRRLFPRVRLDPDVLYTHERTPEGDVLTAAGEAAGIDLCLYMIRCDHGAAVANDVARTTVVPPHREGGQAQFVPRPVAEPSARSSTGAARAWALGRLDRPLSLRELAERESMSVRTFTRRFREETGLTPVQWLTRQRIERARQLLEETDLPVDAVAARSGFGTGASLRQHMQSALGVSPRAYRVTFRGGEESGESRESRDGELLGREREFRGQDG
ncbi:transcriptional regulator GlxA family with amidase domain [Streptomyces sp. Amel2xB2]|uniref:GlxA family transcriptional regulator n=1 Tax=Streptomyces sp. Amel2xB2 TaxID=1305829 RepID=UPI000DBA2BEA|nr:helix-turn-helix domain-containing protein [Streptomyces sp. Amel2xB2]RAJ67068.1 transcriptional regulator GlxA family with amidase domain [Streptomyces sp. Amel2xB2]